MPSSVNVRRPPAATQNDHGRLNCYRHQHVPAVAVMMKIKPTETDFVSDQCDFRIKFDRRIMPTGGSLRCLEACEASGESKIEKRFVVGNEKMRLRRFENLRHDL